MANSIKKLGQNSQQKINSMCLDTYNDDDDDNCSDYELLELLYNIEEEFDDEDY